MPRQVRKQNRLNGYDYSTNGYYYVTICTQNRKYIFGDIVNNEMILNNYGNICHQHLLNLPDYYKHIKIDTHIIMSNHVHAIVVIDNHNSDKLIDIDNGQALGLSLHNLSRYDLSIHNQNISLSKIMRDFKSFSSREINKIICRTKVCMPKACRDKAKPCPILFKWQRSFHDHIIRNDKSLQTIREYIINNPATWEKDENNINSLGFQADNG